jgi:hypothetical protein
MSSHLELLETFVADELAARLQEKMIYSRYYTDCAVLQVPISEP